VELAWSALRGRSEVVLDIDKTSLRITESTILSCSLRIVTHLAECLPVRAIPEQFLIAAMRNDVIHDLTYDYFTIPFMFRTEGMLHYEALPGLIPSRRVAAIVPTSPIPFREGFPFLLRKVANRSVNRRRDGHRR
jgi:hypothetical protein